MLLMGEALAGLMHKRGIHAFFKCLLGGVAASHVGAKVELPLQFIDKGRLASGSPHRGVCLRHVASLLAHHVVRYDGRFSVHWGVRRCPALRVHLLHLGLLAVRLSKGKLVFRGRHVAARRDVILSWPRVESLLRRLRLQRHVVRIYPCIDLRPGVGQLGGRLYLGLLHQAVRSLLTRGAILDF